VRQIYAWSGAAVTPANAPTTEADCCIDNDAMWRGSLCIRSFKTGIFMEHYSAKVLNESRGIKKTVASK
jgi:hypothetical protein